MLLVPKLADGNLLHAKFDAGLLRASAHLLSGDFQGIGFASNDAPTYAMTTSSDACPGGDLPCLVGSILPIGPNVTSHIPPWEFIFFCLLTVDNGSRLTLEAHITETPEPDGVLQAAAHVFGLPDIQAVVEVGSDDHDAALRHVLTLTDRPYVSQVRVLQTSRDFTRGFGGREPAGVAP